MYVLMLVLSSGRRSGGLAKIENLQHSLYMFLFAGRDVNKLYTEQL